MLCWMISALTTVERVMSLQDQTNSRVILKRTPVHGTMTTLSAFFGKGLRGYILRAQLGMVSILLTASKNFVLAVTLWKLDLEMHHVTTNKTEFIKQFRVALQDSRFCNIYNIFIYLSGVYSIKLALPDCHTVNLQHSGPLKVKGFMAVACFDLQVGNPAF